MNFKNTNYTPMKGRKNMMDRVKGKVELPEWWEIEMRVLVWRREMMWRIFHGWEEIFQKFAEMESLESISMMIVEIEHSSPCYFSSDFLFLA